MTLKKEMGIIYFYNIFINSDECVSSENHSKIVILFCLEKGQIPLNGNKFNQNVKLNYIFIVLMHFIFASDITYRPAMHTLGSPHDGTIPTTIWDARSCTCAPVNTRSSVFAWIHLQSTGSHHMSIKYQHVR